MKEVQNKKTQKSVLFCVFLFLFYFIVKILIIQYIYAK